VVEITPAVGIHMGGYWGRCSAATAIGDALWAKALVFAHGEERLALVCLDLVALSADVVAQVRRRIEEDIGIKAAAVMVCCSHTHAGPLTLNFRGMGEVDARYLIRVQDSALEAVGRALAESTVATLRYARPPLQIGINRRQMLAGIASLGRDKEGPVVSYAHALYVEGRGATLAVLFSHACHPVVLGSANHEISGDFVGAAARRIEAQLGCPALFVNGACGDVKPRLSNADFAAVEELGGELAEAVLQGHRVSELVSVPALRHGQRHVELPLLSPPSRLRAEVERLALKLKVGIKVGLGGADSWAQRVPRAQLEWIEEVLAHGGGARTQAFEIQGLVLGRLVLLGMEGEIFARYQLDIEAEHGGVVVCGYANGCIGYVPTADEYARGGYEIEMAYKVYPSVLMIAPESEGVLRAAVVELMAELGQRD
jgi:hypothetical protein